MATIECLCCLDKIILTLPDSLPLSVQKATEIMAQKNYEKKKLERLFQTPPILTSLYIWLITG